MAFFSTAMSFTYKHPHPAVTVDCVVFGYDARRESDSAADVLRVLLIKRKQEPFKGKWALPGGFIHLDETLDAAAARELREETGVSGAYIEQLYTFGAVERDPRERVVSVAYFALVNLERHRLAAGTDASDARWFVLGAAPTLAFDHAHILEVAVQRLRAKVRYQPIGFELLPDEFTLSELQTLYEVVLERSFDKRNFRKKIERYDLLIDTGGMRRGKPHRAAKLYRFDAARYKKLEKHGFTFEL